MVINYTVWFIYINIIKKVYSTDFVLQFHKYNGLRRDKINKQRLRYYDV